MNWKTNEDANSNFTNGLEKMFGLNSLPGNYLFNISVRHIQENQKIVNVPEKFLINLRVVHSSLMGLIRRGDTPLQERV